MSTTTTTTATATRPGTDATAPAGNLTPPRGSRRVTRRDMADAVADRVPFRYNASASATWATASAVRRAVGGLGCHLDPAAAAEVAEHLAGLDLAAPVYVVRSYSTVVAVYTDAAGWWTWDARYSATTGTHLAAVRRGIAAAR